MKHLKTYKLFKENLSPYTQTDLDEICQDIKEILIGLVDDEIQLNVDSFQEGQPYIDIQIDADEESFEKYEDEFKHLFSYMYKMEWEILPLGQKTFYSYYTVDGADPEFRCPVCQETNIDLTNDEQEVTCENCGHKEDMNEFMSYDYKFDTPYGLIELLEYDSDGIRIIFKMQ